MCTTPLACRKLSALAISRATRRPRRYLRLREAGGGRQCGGSTSRAVHRRLRWVEARSSSCRSTPASHAPGPGSNQQATRTPPRRTSRTAVLRSQPRQGLARSAGPSLRSTWGQGAGVQAGPMSWAGAGPGGAARRGSAALRSCTPQPMRRIVCCLLLARTHTHQSTGRCSTREHTTHSIRMMPGQKGEGSRCRA